MCAYVCFHSATRHTTLLSSSVTSTRTTCSSPHDVTNHKLPPPQLPPALASHADLLVEDALRSPSRTQPRQHARSNGGVVKTKPTVKASSGRGATRTMGKDTGTSRYHRKLHEVKNYIQQLKTEALPADNGGGDRATSAAPRGQTRATTSSTAPNNPEPRASSRPTITVSTKLANPPPITATSSRPSRLPQPTTTSTKRPSAPASSRPSGPASSRPPVPASSRPPATRLPSTTQPQPPRPFAPLPPLEPFVPSRGLAIPALQLRRPMPDLLNDTLRSSALRRDFYGELRTAYGQMWGWLKEG
ncbi:hypothetical protein BC936DRAFT_138486 [Jimgerdemannia flammicorona]|uniref:Uncharacterized protein n=1 Tax=Jimgerdemannia flammicorona TaxID=994334 RepID=A0A433CC97_9FUNG|nr:hypothetical protein BC936DRAFT_138486 [Jimgerdemannia flammicorona]